MERKMLIGIKQRSERLARESEAQTTANVRDIEHAHNP